jgi:flagellar basal body-associated protein FliL
MTTKKLKILIIVLIIFIIIFAYSLFSRGKGAKIDKNVVSAPKDAKTAQQETAQLSEGAEMIKILNQLKSIKLDTDFFENQIFKSLNDSSKELMTEAKGRSNPFAPLFIPVSEELLE